MRCRCLLLAATLGGCVSNWQAIPSTPSQALQDLGPGEARIKRANGDYVVLRDPAILGDSVVGWEVPPWDKGGGPARRGVALTDVRQLAVKKNDPVANIFLGVVVGTFAFGYLVLAPALAGMSD